MSTAVAATAIALLAALLTAAPAAADDDADLRVGPRWSIADGQTVTVVVHNAPSRVRIQLCPADGRIGRHQCVRVRPTNVRRTAGVFRARVALPRSTGTFDCAIHRRACEVRVFAGTGAAIDRVGIDFVPHHICNVDHITKPDIAPRAGIAAVQRALAHPDLAALVTSASIWVEGFGEVAAARPDRLMIPASNQKIYTAIGALALLPEDHRFITTIAIRGDDLILHASGDPTFGRDGDAAIHGLADQLLDEGITSARRLVIDASRYDTPLLVGGWPSWTVPRYAGPLSTFTLDNNERRTDAAYVAKPDRHNGRIVAEVLRARGIDIDRVVVSRRPVRNDTTVAWAPSRPTRDMVREMLRFSDNRIADNLLLEIGAMTGRGGTQDGGAAAIDSWLRDRCPNPSGIADDGSGLSYANWRSTREWQQVLRAIQDEPWFGLFEQALPVSGSSGTLRRRFLTAQTLGNVRAKTGTVFGARALSGYATTVGGREIVFSIVTNGDNDPAARSRVPLDAVIKAAIAIDA